jgi:hypothetical protein
LGGRGRSQSPIPYLFFNAPIFFRPSITPLLLQSLHTNEKGSTIALNVWGM